MSYRACGRATVSTMALTQCWADASVSNEASSSSLENANHIHVRVGGRIETIATRYRIVRFGKIVDSM